MPFFDLVQGVGVVVPEAVLASLARRGAGRGDAHEVTGMSPQSSTVAQLLKGFVSRGTLYPPLRGRVSSTL